MASKSSLRPFLVPLAVAAAPLAHGAGAASLDSAAAAERSAQSAKNFAVGLAQQRLDQLAEAEASYEQAILADAGDWTPGLRQKVSLYGEVLAWQGKTQAAREVFDAATQSGLFESPLERPLTPTEDARLLGRTSPWYDDAELRRWLPGLARARQLLEDAAGEIRAEYVAYRAKHPQLVREHPDGLVAAPRGSWKQLPLGFDSGDAAPWDCQGLCPRTAETLRRVETDLCFGRVCPRRAEFSILAAGARLRPHCGPTNLSLTLHLGLVCPCATEAAAAAERRRRNGAQVPAPPSNGSAARAAARLCLAGECREWREGELFVFDEAFEHEAWGPSEGERVVLLFKVPHPGLERDTYERLYGEYLGNASILDAVRNEGEALFLSDLSQ